MRHSMKRASALLLALLLFVSALPTALGETYTGTVNEDKVFFRTQPNTDCVYYCQLAKGTKVKVTGTSGNFYKVTYDGNSGYVMQKFVTLPDSAKNALGTAKSSSTYASATSISQLGGPPDYTQFGSSGKNVEKLQQALKIKGYYTATVDGKYGQNTENAVKAYQKAVGITQTGKADYATIMKLFGSVQSTTVQNDPKMDGITSISQITVPATSQPGNSGKNVIALQQALKIKGYFKAPIDGKYGDATKEAVLAFQKAKGLYQDGIAGNNTIKDVYTGKTFKAQRRFGSNHLDSEPLTAEDTATLKSIYGGEWSWGRRPILVKYNGHVYAASMNGMPHGTCTITNNNFDGHFCIHFYNSKTHETKRVDEAHQHCVSVAMNNVW